MANGVPNYLANIQGGVSPLQRATQGAQALQGIRSNELALGQAREAQKEQERQRMFTQKVQESFQGGQPDYAMLASEFPEYVGQIQQIKGFSDQVKQSGITEPASRVYEALSRGDSDAAASIIQENPQVVDSIGDPEFTSEVAINMAKQNPEMLRQIAEGVLLVSEGPDALLKARRPQEEGLTEYQKQQVQLKREDQRLRQLETNLSKEKNDLQKQKLENEIKIQEQKIEDSKLKSEAAQGKRSASLQLAKEAKNVVDSLLGNENLDRIIGTVGISPLVPTVRGTSQDLINEATRLQSLLTVDNLKLMTGVLTDRDIKFLTDVASGLNVTEQGIKGSEEGVKRRLNQISETLSRSISEAPEEQQQNVINWEDL